jgi:type I restriction enzyme, S subunit
MSFRQYPTYKDSGVDWLGEVPDHWALKPLWTHFRRVKRVGHSDEQLLSVYRDFGVIPKASRDDNFNNASDDLSVYQLVIPGDLAINKMKAWQGSVAISEHRGIVSPAYFVYEALHSANSRYFHYLMRSLRYITGYLSASKGIRINQWDLEPQIHSRMPLTIPPLVEQTCIAAFLDSETAKIDGLVAEQQRLIDLLKEKRQAVISHAVTKGLNPAAPMKPSGIEWLGDVPAHWETGPLKRYWAATDCKHLTADFIEDGIPLVSIREVQGRWVSFENAKCTTETFYEQLIEGGRNPIPGDLIFSRNATVGEVAQVPDNPPRFAMGQDVVLLRKLRRDFSSDFMYHVIRSPIITQQLAVMMIGSTFKRINVEEIRSFQVPTPPAGEQSQIARFLESETQRFDALTAEAQRAIDLLQERRTALISAAVTGQIDVRHLAEASAA